MNFGRIIIAIKRGAMIESIVAMIRESEQIVSNLDVYFDRYGSQHDHIPFNFSDMIVFLIYSLWLHFYGPMEISPRCLPNFSSTLLHFPHLPVFLPNTLFPLGLFLEFPLPTVILPSIYISLIHP